MRAIIIFINNSNMFYCTFFRVKKRLPPPGALVPGAPPPSGYKKKPPSRNGKGGKTWTGGGENKARKRRETSPRTERSFPEPGPPFLRQKTRPHTAPDGRKTARHVSARLPARGTARPCLRDTPRREAMPGADREAAALPGHAGRARLRKRRINAKEPQTYVCGSCLLTGAQGETRTPTPFGATTSR